MKVVTFFLSGIVLAALASLSAEEKTVLDLDKNIEVKPAVIYRNIAVFPVYRKQKKIDAAHYITLDEGIANHTVVVTEKGVRLLSQNETAELAKLQSEMNKLREQFGGHLEYYQANNLNDNPAVNLENEEIPVQQQNAPTRAYSQRRSLPKLSEEQKKALPQIKEQFQKISARVSELAPSGGTVNWLDIQNNSAKTLYLMAGEMVVGGKQDRIVGVDTVVPAGGKATIQVFCVEHGRWQVETDKFASMNAMAHGKIRAIAQGKQNQAEVWQEVSKANDKLKTQNSTDTYRKNYENPEVLNKLKEYTQIVEVPLKTENTTGVFIAIHGELVGVDIFANAKLFERVRDKLIRSYCMEAILAEDDAVAGLKHPGLAEVQKFFTQLKESKVKITNKDGKYANFHIEGNDFESFGTLQADENESVLHLNSYRKK